MPVSSSLEVAADLLNQWGFPVVKRAGWASKKARSDIAFVPAGVIFHHTAAWGTTDSMLFDKGNGKVKGPLCNWSIDRDGRITLGAAGYANHAGINSRAAVAKILAGADAEVKPGPDDNYSANRYTVGVEVKCPGAYNEAQRRAAVALGAALVIAFGWDKVKVPVGAHKEITRRKPGDPGDDMGAFRTEVRALIVAKTAPVKPAAEPPKPAKSAQVTVLVANCQSYDGDKSEAAWRARAALMASFSPDVILVQETSEPGRNVMRLALGAGWRYYSNGKSVALFVGPRVKTAGLKRTVSFGTAFGHGAVKLPLKVDGIGFDATSQHTRPGSVASNAQKDADIAKGSKLTGSWPGIFGGDFARDNPKLPGWQRITPVVDSMDKAGTQTPDAIFTRGKVSVVGAKVIDPGRLSDHKWLVATLTVSA